MNDDQHWQDWANFLLGLWIFGSPWLLEHSMSTELVSGGVLGMWDLWLTGLSISVIATIAIYAFKPWRECLDLVLSAWLLVSPWALGFSKSSVLMWNAVTLGVLVFMLASCALAEDKGRTSATF